MENVFVEKGAEQALQGIAYLPHLVFEEERVQKRSSRAWKRRGELPLNKIWLGSYFGPALQKQIFPQTVLRSIGNGIGYGLFARGEIPPFTLVGEYTGIIRRRKAAKDRFLRYSMRYPIGFFSFSTWLIDAEKQGNHMRFINHSQNANICVKSLFYEGLMRMAMVSQKKINPGEQLLLDYGHLYWKQLKEIPLEMGPAC